MVQAAPQDKRRKQDDVAMLRRNVIAAMQGLSLAAIPTMLRQIADDIEQEHDTEQTAEQQATLHQALVTLAKHQLDLDDQTDEETLLKAQRIMRNALREGKLNREIFATTRDEARQIVKQERQRRTPHYPEIVLKEALLNIALHRLKPEDKADEEAIAAAEKTMSDALYRGELTDELVHWAWREAERKLGIATDYEDDEDNEVIPLLARAELHGLSAPPPTDEQMAQWWDEYYMRHS